MSAAANSWGPTLSSDRIRLEAIDPRRARAILLGTPEPDLPWEDGFPLPAILDILQTIAEAGEPLGPFLAYVIVRRSDGLAIGDAGFHGPPGADGEVELAYALVPAARGHGLASEAARLLIAWAGTQPGVGDITARVDAGNTSSERLLQRLGFVADGERNGLQRFILRR
jgi:RimJ/RimL family protein N-acetyltransferase